MFLLSNPYSSAQELCYGIEETSSVNDAPFVEYQVLIPAITKTSRNRDSASVINVH